MAHRKTKAQKFAEGFGQGSGQYMKMKMYGQMMKDIGRPDTGASIDQKRKECAALGPTFTFNEAAAQCLPTTPDPDVTRPQAPVLDPQRRAPGDPTLIPT